MTNVNPLSTEWYRCIKCKTSYFIRAGDPELHLLRKKMRCPQFATCGGNIHHRNFTVNTHTVPNARWISALELFQAAAGIGLPEERNCSVTDVRRAMVGSRISEVHLEKAPDPKKSILMSFTLDNGKVIHLATSTKGAIIYKVTEAGHGR
jgi:hypothetical protein